MSLYSQEWAFKTLSEVPASVLSILNGIIKSEGGFVNSKTDAGGATNFGVSIVAARSKGVAYFDYNGNGVVDVDDIKRITPEIAKAFFFTEYFIYPKFNMLPETIWPVALDMSVNMGSPTAAIIIQSSNFVAQTASGMGIHLAPDGIVGSTTAKVCASAAKINEKNLINGICDRRIEEYREIVRKRPANSIYLKGWINRASSFYS